MSEAIALREGKEVALPIDQLVEGDLVRFSWRPDLCGWGRAGGRAKSR